MATVNEEFFDAAVGHAIDLSRYSNGEVRRMIRLLNKSDAVLFDRLDKALQRLDQDSFTVKRLESLLKSVKDINEQAYKQVFDEFQGDLFDLTDYETNYQAQLFKDTLPTVVSIATVAPQQVHAAAMAQPFRGRILSEWAQSLEANRLQRIKDGIAIGFTNNETIAQIVQRIKGTKALNYKDGLIDIDRRHAEAVVRTAINHISQFAREDFYQENESLIKGIQLIETLDPRTCEYCMSLDGKVYPINKGPRAPHHWNCRGSSVPVIKSWRDLGIDEDELDAGTRSSMDGQVPANLSYGAWLRKQSAERQNEILGPTKAKLYRDGGLEIDAFSNRNGHVYTLDELRQRDSAAFQRAGL